MRVLLSKKEMKECDQMTIRKFGMPSLVLMERAALGCVHHLYQSKADLKRILVVCGPGNNGGDGFAIARLLFQDGLDVTAWLIGKESSCTAETAKQMELCRAYGVPIRTFSDLCPHGSFFCGNTGMSEYTVIVDALFGIGLSRDIEGACAEVIKQINHSQAFVLSVDIPSGIDGDTGTVRGTAVQADMTVTFGYEQPGHYLGKGRVCSRKVILCPIGITKESLPETAGRCYLYEEQDLRLPPVPEDAHKGVCGKVLLVAGSTEFCGAAILCAKAACRMGAGLIRVYTEECNKPVIQQSVPEVIVSCCGEMWTKKLSELLEWADAVAVGPGIGTGKEKREILEYILEYGKKPLILDADALNLAASCEMDFSGYTAGIMVTPHLGEMARLCKTTVAEISSDLCRYASSYALENRLVCVLKDAGTVVSDGAEIYVNASGNSGMAGGGSGDVLTGILAVLAAQGMPLFKAARLGVYLHGKAGDAAAKRLGKRSMSASDIADSLPDVIR